MQHQKIPMRQDPVFNKDGIYNFVVERNVALHQEAIAIGKQIAAKHFQSYPTHTLRVLDLACGSLPIIIAAIMEYLSSFRFSYTGVDINADQVAACKKFNFSSNVSELQVIEGNIWLLEEIPLKPKYDLIFSGLNIHHGTPEEILYLGRQIIDPFLAPRGLLLNHDVYRPAKYDYLRRPDWNPNKPDQAMGFISKEKLKAACISVPLSKEFAKKPTKDWREDWLSLHKLHLMRSGLSEKEAEDGIHHMRERDYPVSLPEMKFILEKCGFEVTLHDYLNTGHPTPEYYGMVAATPNRLT